MVTPSALRQSEIDKHTLPGAGSIPALATRVTSLDPVSARAGIVVTGTEVLTGRVQDRNGPWIADRLLELGVELAHITICGDRPRDIEAQLRFMADEGVDLIVTSGGLGPTADDMTVEVVARFCGRELVLDEELDDKIAAILKPLMARFGHWDFDAVRAANRKQAMIPAGSHVIDPVGTAPGVVVPGKPTVVVLPGPPRELQPMWRTAVETEAVQEAIAGRTHYRQETVRMFGLPESGLADTLRDAQQAIPGFDLLEITTCLRRGEIEMVTRYEPARGGRAREAGSAAAGAPWPGDILGRRFTRGRSGRAAAGRAPGGDGRVVYRGSSGGAADGAAGLIGLHRRRGGCLCQRGEGGTARRGPGTDRGTRGGVRAGGRGHGRGRAAPFRRGHRDCHHRDRGSGWGIGGQAGGDGLLQRDAGQRPDADPHGPAAR